VLGRDFNSRGMETCRGSIPPLRRLCCFFPGDYHVIARGPIKISKKLFTLLDLCVSSLRRGHANLLCIVPILTDDPRRESETALWGSSPGQLQACLARWVHVGEGGNKKCKEVVPAHHTEVIASCSELLSLHCPRHLLLLALLPACAGSQVIMRQDCSAYAEEPLRTVGLLEAAHQYSLQDMCGSASIPILTLLPTQERQFKNL
jgi:hypothetical protein